MHAICTLVLWLPTLFAGPQPDLGRAIGRLLDDLPDDGVAVGAMVVRLPDHEVIFSRDAERPLVPASCQKVISAAVALDVLGSDYAFETGLLRCGQDLVLVGGGDPAFGDPRLAQQRGEDPLAVLRGWADIVAGAASAEGPGRLLIDDSAFEGLRTHPSWEARDLPKWFAAPVGALNFNDNCVEFTLTPTRPGREVTYTVFPPNDWLEIENRCTTGQRKPWIHRLPERTVFQLRGETDDVVELQSVSVPDPGVFTAEVFRRVLRERGVALTGPIERVQVDEMCARPQWLGRAQTPIRDVLTRALRDSQNLFAECLIKAAVRRASLTAGTPRPGNWSDSEPLVRSRLGAWRVDPTALAFADGSGLSRDNRASAAQLVGVLRHVYSGMPRQAGDGFIASLAEGGRSGTLGKRMKHLSGKVYAKTGYLRGVRSLCGYVAPGDGGHWYVFAVLFNDIPGGTRPYSDIQDRLCRLLAESHDDGG